ncbi:MAG: ketoacyl-ACP synthase III [Patescibacteria group bacterium]|nr:ketoacyl-ACP synthase III [Patescibacteria group bacterium]
MAFLKHNNIKIRGIATAVPKDKVDNLICNDNFTKEEAEKFVNSTGIRYRRISADNQTTSDLGLIAAESLIYSLGINKESIDGLIFLSQSPDYILPATSIILQEKLGLSKSTFAFDISLGCSGYVYVLSVASAFLANGQLNNILFICGDTPSKYISKKDKSAVLLLGDAASATIISKGNSNIYFSLNSDGSGKDILKIDSGMFRNPVSSETLIAKPGVDGNIRCANQLFMDGMEVFNFTMKEIKKDTEKLLNFAKYDLSSIDFFVFHQANMFINSFLEKKMKIPKQKVLYSLKEFGNTSATTIPLTVCLNKNELINKNTTLLLSAFGVGLSWANCIIEFNEDILICEIIEV